MIVFCDYYLSTTLLTIFLPSELFHFASIILKMGRARPSGSRKGRPSLFLYLLRHTGGDGKHPIPIFTQGLTDTCPIF